MPATRPAWRAQSCLFEAPGWTRRSLIAASVSSSEKWRGAIRHPDICRIVGNHCVVVAAAPVSSSSLNVSAVSADWIRGRHRHLRAAALHESRFPHQEREAAMTRRFILAPTALALCSISFSAPASADSDGDSASRKTASPIKHVIVLIGENRSFDNVYGTYDPRPGQSVSNLRTSKIVREDGSLGSRASLAAQVALNAIPSQYFIHQPASNKALGVTLAQIAQDPGDSVPPLDPGISLADLHTISPVLPLDALRLLTTGATGQTICNVSATQPWPVFPPAGCSETDMRVANFLSLPNSVFPLAGPKLPYDSYTGDMVHRFYHMWQQSDCSADDATTANPSGCLNDLYPYVGVARGDGSGGNAMGFYNVEQGDAPVFKRLADEYTMSDNFHQSIMGGTAVQHTLMMTGDQIFWESSGSIPAQPPVTAIVDPTPKSATNPAFVRD